MALPPKPATLGEDIEDGVLQRTLNPFMKDTANALDGSLSIVRNMNADKKVIRVTIPDVPWTSLEPYFQTGVSNYLSYTSARYLVTPGGRVYLEGLLNVPATNPVNVLALPASLAPARYMENAASGGSGNLCVMRIERDGVISKTGANIFLDIGFSYQLPATATTSAVLPFSGPGWPILMKTAVQGRPLAVLALSARDLGTNPNAVNVIAGLDWSYGSGDKIIIKRIEGLLPGHTYEISFLIIGE